MNTPSPPPLNTFYLHTSTIITLLSTISSCYLLFHLLLLLSGDSVMMVDPLTGADMCARDDATTTTTTGSASLFTYSDTAVLGENTLGENFGESTMGSLPESASVTLDGEKLTVSELVPGSEEGEEGEEAGEEAEEEREEEGEQGVQEEDRVVVLSSPSIRLSLGGQTAEAFDRSLSSEPTSSIINHNTSIATATTAEKQQQQRERDLRRTTVDAADLAALLLDGSELNDGSTMTGYSHTNGSDRESLGGGSVDGGSVGGMDVSSEGEGDQDHSLNVSVSRSASIAPSITSLPAPPSVQIYPQTTSSIAFPSLLSTASRGQSTDEYSEHPSLQGVSMEVSMGGEVMPLDVSTTTAFGSILSTGRASAGGASTGGASTEGSVHSTHPHQPMEEEEAVPQLHGHPSPHGGRTRASWLSTVSQLTAGGSINETSVNEGSVVTSGPFSSQSKQMEEGEVMEVGEETTTHSNNDNISNHNTSNDHMPIANSSRESLGFDFSAHMSHDHNDDDDEGSTYEGQGLAGMNNERRATVDPADMLMLLQCLEEEEGEGHPTHHHPVATMSHTHPMTQSVAGGSVGSSGGASGNEWLEGALDDSVARYRMTPSLFHTPCYHTRTTLRTPSFVSSLSLIPPPLPCPLFFPSLNCSSPTSLYFLFLLSLSIV